jgi:hypothetical protein
MRNLGSKLFVFLVVAAIVGGLGYAFFPEPAEVDLATIERGTVRVTVDEDGKTRIHEKYVVSAPLVGRLLRINMDAGDPVVAGKTLLATIEPICSMRDRLPKRKRESKAPRPRLRRSSRNWKWSARHRLMRKRK